MKKLFLFAIPFIFLAGCNLPGVSNKMETIPKPPLNTPIVSESAPPNVSPSPAETPEITPIDSVNNFSLCREAGYETKGEFPGRKCTTPEGMIFSEGAEGVDLVPITKTDAACTTDADCVPVPGCHPMQCINKSSEAAGVVDPNMGCTRMLDCSAAYQPKDCGCVNGFCANNNLGNKGCPDFPGKDACPDTEELVCGETSICECQYGDGPDGVVSAQPNDGTEVCAENCERITTKTTYLNRCELDQNNALFVYEGECEFPTFPGGSESPASAPYDLDIY